MMLIEIGLLLVAGVAAGAMNAVVGAGSLITFPTLLALGFPPVVANVSNTVGMVPGSVSGAYAYRATLVGRWRLVRLLVVASSTGGAAGAVLLLALPPGAFAIVVPPLLLLSGVLAAIQPKVAAAIARRRTATQPTGRNPRPVSSVGDVRTTDPRLLASIAAAGVYGGYFGAAQGVILLALLGIFIEGGMTQVNGIKNVLAGSANLISAVIFLLVANVDWAATLVIAVGASIGGGVGGRYGRRLPAGPLRGLVVAIALVAAAWQFLS